MMDIELLSKYPENGDIYDSLRSSIAEKLMHCFYFKCFPSGSAERDLIYWNGNDFSSVYSPCGFDATGEYDLRADVMSGIGAFPVLWDALAHAYMDCLAFRLGEEYCDFEDFYTNDITSFIKNHTDNSSGTSAERELHSLLMLYAVPGYEADENNVMLLASKEIGWFLDYAGNNPCDPDVVLVLTALNFIENCITTLDISKAFLIDGCYFLCFIFASYGILSRIGEFGTSSGLHPLIYYALSIISDGIANIKDKIKE